MPDYEYNLHGFFTSAKVGKQVAATIDVYDLSDNKVINNATATVNVAGFARYTYITSIPGDYRGVFKTVDTTVDLQHVPSLGTKEIVYLDDFMTSRLASGDYVAPDNSGILTAIGTRLASGDYVVPPTKEQVSAEVWSNPTRTLSSFGNLMQSIWEYEIRTLTSSSGGASAQEVWEYGIRTLTSSREQVLEQMSGDNLSIRRGDIYTYDFTGLGSLIGRTSLYVTMKKNKSLEDSDSIVQTSESGGLIVLNGSSESLTSSWASIVVLDENVGNIRLTLKPQLTSLFIPVKENYFDVQFSNSSGTFTPREGLYEVTADVTRRLT